MNKKEIQTWIAEARKKGYSRAQIEGELKKQDYNADMINKVFGNNKSNNNGRRNKNILTLSILVILILGIIGYFAFYRPSTIGYKLNKAELLEQEGKTDEALRIYQGILIEYPNTTWAYISSYRAGNIYFNKEDHKSATPYFKRAVNLNPNDCDSNSKLGQIYFRKRDFNTSLQYFLTASEINNKSKEYCSKQMVENNNFNIGKIYLKKGSYGNAIGYLKAAYKLDTDNSMSIEINYELGKAYYLGNNYAEAEVYLNNYLKLNPTNKDNIETAQDYLKTIQENKKPA